MLKKWENLSNMTRGYMSYNAKFKAVLSLIRARVYVTFQLES